MRPFFYYGYVVLFLCFLNMVFVRRAFGSFSVFYVALLEDFHWSHGVGTILGFLEITFGLGMALGSWSGGVIFDLTGSYRWAFVLSLICFVVSFLAIHASTTWHQKQAVSRRLTGLETRRGKV